MYSILHGDARDMMLMIGADCFHAIVTDPPYGLKFMGKAWDYGIPGVPFWTEALRVAKPGAHLLAFGGTRTFHRLTCAIEDAGWEIRDCVMWVYGSGFPKSHNISKQIDKMEGVKREVVGTRTDGRGASPSKIANHGKGDTGIGHADGSKQVYEETISTSDAARQWEGWGTALKPAWEPIILARKPLIGTVAANVQQFGTGGLNIDGCRVETSDNLNGGGYSENYQGSSFLKYGGKLEFEQPIGRWPANLIHDGSEEVVELFPQSKSTGGKGEASGLIDNASIYGKFSGDNKGANAGGLGDSGSAARFFYCAKVSRSERGEGNTHPTVKPLALMRYLIRLVAPKESLVLDPFVGSGSTIIACEKEKVHCVGIDNDVSSIQIAVNRVKVACG